LGADHDEIASQTLGRAEDFVGGVPGHDDQCNLVLNRRNTRNRTVDESRELDPRTLDESLSPGGRPTRGGQQEWIVHEHRCDPATESMRGRDRVLKGIARVRRKIHRTENRPEPHRGLVPHHHIISGLLATRYTRPIPGQTRRT
jgi:hypothetical protein